LAIAVALAAARFVTAVDVSRKRPKRRATGLIGR
jgi:hypothetical protein